MRDAYQGYDNGGWLRPGLTMAWNGTRIPERVVPAGGAGPCAITITVKVDPAIAAVTPDARLGQHIAQHVTAAIKRGARLYPAGWTPQ